MSASNPNIPSVAGKLGELTERKPEVDLLQKLQTRAELVTARPATKLVAGIDSSDNLLLNIPDHPGAAVAGYSFALVVSDTDGNAKFVQERLAEKDNDEQLEQLEIALVYSVPLPETQRLLHFSDYQLRVFINTPVSVSPYEFDDLIPEFKIRLVAARHRETTERHAIRTSFFQSEIPFQLFLKDGRHSSQNVSARFTDEIGRRAVERGVRYVGVVKQGTRLWSLLYPYHQAMYAWSGCKAYWAVIPSELILQAYATTQIEPKTLRLGAQENQSLGGIGGAWILYGNGARSFYVLEFNVYDLAEFKPLVQSGFPLERYVKQAHSWEKTFVASLEENHYIGTQTLIRDEDIEQLIIPTVSEIHHLAEASLTSYRYPIVLADAHRRCKITRERKNRINSELIAALQKMGFHPVDFETWSEDPHKMFEE